MPHPCMGLSAKASLKHKQRCRSNTVGQQDGRQWEVSHDHTYACMHTPAVGITVTVTDDTAMLWMAH